MCAAHSSSQQLYPDSAGLTRSTEGSHVPLGRQNEWKLLQRLQQQAASGQTRSLLLLGDAGSGKSYLLRAYAEQSRACCLYMDLDECASYAVFEQQLDVALQAWLERVLRQALARLREVPHAVEEAQQAGWQWERSHLEQLMMLMPASLNDPSLEAMVQYLNELWQESFSNWKRLGFSLQDTAEQLFRRLNYPELLACQQFRRHRERSLPFSAFVPHWLALLKNHGLSGTLIIDHWDTLALQTKPEQAQFRKQLQQVLSEQNESQRHEPLLLIVSSRSEQLSTLLGSECYSQFRSKHLLNPLSATHAAKLLSQKEPIFWGEPEAVDYISEAFTENLHEWFLVSDSLKAYAQQQGYTGAVNTKFLEAFTPLTAVNMLALGFAKIELSSLGQTAQLDKAMGLLLNQVRRSAFEVEPCLALWQKELHWSEDEGFQCLRLLFLQQFLELAPSGVDGEPRYQWSSRVTFDYLWARFTSAHPANAPRLQQPVLERVLHLAIANGELSQQQLLELLKLGQSTPNAEAFQHRIESLLFVYEDHPEVRVRLTVLGALVAMKANGLLAYLKRALTDESPVLREYTALHIKRQAAWLRQLPQIEELMKALSYCFKDGCQQVRYRATDAYMALAQKATTAAPEAKLLFYGLEDPAPGVKSLWLKQLLQLPRSSIVALQQDAGFYQALLPVLEKLLEQETASAARGLIYQVLATYASESEAIALLTPYLQNERDRLAQQDLVNGLCKASSLQRIETLVSKLKDLDTPLDESAQLAIAKVLGKETTPGAEDFLQELLQEPYVSRWSEPVFWMLLRSLGRLGRSPASYQLLEALQHDSRAQRQPLIATILQSTRNRIAKRLKGQALPDKSPAVAGQLPNATTQPASLPSHAHHEEAFVTVVSNNSDTGHEDGLPEEESASSFLSSEEQLLQA